MSQIEHRKQLRALRERRQDRNKIVMRPQRAATEPTVVPPPAAITPPDTTFAQPAPVVATPAVEPRPVNPGANTPDQMTPQQMRMQARTTAETLCQLPTDQYQQALSDLREQHPTFYSVVADELNNMAAQAAQLEGDGHDLSALINGGAETRQQDAVQTPADPTTESTGKP